MGLGLIVTALFHTGNRFGRCIPAITGAKASVWWIIGTYGVVTIGELCLRPNRLVGSQKWRHPHKAGLMMGGGVLSTSIGNSSSGVAHHNGISTTTRQMLFLG
ncbi:MAG: hypothetical protein IPL65_19225 [Lewinellaceae bacterium]|nr:hypothetical protein [Lewinellaceae bacterium]